MRWIASTRFKTEKQDRKTFLTLLATVCEQYLPVLLRGGLREQYKMITKLLSYRSWELLNEE